MTFFIPPVFLFGNNANIYNNEKKKSEYKTATETEIKVENWRVKRIAELEEENKNLRAYADNLDSENDNQAIEIEELKKENKNLKKQLERMKIDTMYDMKDINSLYNENKKLKEKVRFLEECLDRKEKLNEEYRKQLDKYKRQYEHSMGFMEEDTLQELKDIGEL